jgi:thiol:disulfide interchange protein
MFFGVDGVERKNYRVIGYMKADEFSQHIERAFN